MTTTLKNECGDLLATLHTNRGDSHLTMVIHDIEAIRASLDDMADCNGRKEGDTVCKVYHHWLDICYVIDRRG